MKFVGNLFFGYSLSKKVKGKRKKCENVREKILTFHFLYFTFYFSLFP